ncbi:hypothetical protein GGF32_009999 [Allomyces javanicus]|nr:hypothetical protein GGF32_009999 [Allomyces javanicus]
MTAATDAAPARASSHDASLAALAGLDGPDFDPVAYAARILADSEAGAGGTDAELHLSNLAFLASNLTRQIEDYVMDHHPDLVRVVTEFRGAEDDVAWLQTELEQLHTSVTQWKATITEPRDQMAQRLVDVQDHRDVLVLAKALRQYLPLADAIIAAPDPATGSADPPETLSVIGPLASDLAQVDVLLAKMDLSGIREFDNRHALVVKKRSALLARLNQLIAQAVPARDIQGVRGALLALQQLGVLGEWHARRLTKVMGRIERELKDALDTDRAVRDQKAFLNDVMSHLESAMDIVDAEASHVQLLHTSLPSDESLPAQFWTGVASLLSKSLQHAATTSRVYNQILAQSYPRLVRMVRSAATRADTPASTTAPLLAAITFLEPQYTTRVDTAITDAVVAAVPFPPAHLAAAPPSASTMAQLAHVLLAQIDLARPDTQAVIPLVARGIDTARSRITQALVHSGVDSDVVLAMSPHQLTPVQTAVLGLAGALYALYAALADAVDDMDDPRLAAALDAAHGVVAHAADRVLQAVVAATHTAVARLHTHPTAWLDEVAARLRIARDVFRRMAAWGDDGAAWRALAVQAVVELVAAHAASCAPAATAEGRARSRLVSDMATVDGWLAQLMAPGPPSVKDLPTYAHLRAWRRVVSVVWPTDKAVLLGEETMRVARAAWELSPVVTLLHLAVVSGRPMAERRGVSVRDAVTWATNPDGQAVESMVAILSDDSVVGEVVQRLVALGIVSPRS